jgi:adenine-specific DNA-methyltransferase
MGQLGYQPPVQRCMLAEALCKLESFTYAPSETIWFQHGHTTERDFIYVTTQNLSVDQLQAVSEEVGSGRSLLVLCSAFRGVTAEKAAERWPNLTIKKIPKVVLARCEWGQDDYSLNVQNLPMAEPERVSGRERPSRNANEAAAPEQGSLFEEGEQ